MSITPEQAAHETRAAIVRLAGGFMTDPATYVYGAALGFEGMDFYASGRGGVLGDVAADIVTAALVFFAPETVREAWERSASVMPRRDAAREWAGRCHAWALEHLPEDRDWPAFATLLGRVVAAAPVAGAPVFAGWRLLPEPADPRALALHRVNGLRELRGARHAAAVLTVGLTPAEAIAVASPAALSVFGWTDAPADPEPFHERWALAEARTDRMFGRHLRVLDDDERETLVEMLSTLAS